ncbi:phage tail protein [Candidatus Accumulibacter sp. ACC003]|uniref:phage tail protein n=1 Tax=Candidatus Accumulibacter sp. ACC003 TaxID=2823334 RepID=UPI0025C162B0|nr:phage tail protein [Candidatus Accumulibacter sp. ACC003]
MNGVSFELAPPRVAADANRVDVACFVGYVGRRATALPANVRTALAETRWIAGPWARPPAEVEALLQLPVVVDSWNAFDALFAWDSRPIGRGERRCASYLGAAVRSFFANGGRRALIVRCGDPWPYLEVVGNRAAQRTTRLAALLASAANPMDPASWIGIGHLSGLPEVSLLCLPDLADICAADPALVDVAVEPPSSPEVFVDCSSNAVVGVEQDVGLRDLAPPRADHDGFIAWRNAIGTARERLARLHREMLLLAALPLPMQDARNADAWAQADFHAYLENAGVLIEPDSSNGGRAAASAFVQLAWPWLRTSHSTDLPGALEAPDGLLAGVLAINALSRGTFRSVAGSRLAAVSGSEPLLAWSGIAETPSDRLAQRVCVIAPSPVGWALHSDVTASADEAWRAGGVSRLMGALLRAARRAGEAALFEASGPLLWQRIERSLGHLLTAFWREGALGGASPEEAFSVRCDRSTMSQNDLDNGRLRAEVSILPVAAVERISVVLDLTGGGAAEALTNALREVA